MNSLQQKFENFKEITREEDKIISLIKENIKITDFLKNKLDKPRFKIEQKLVII